MSRGQLDIRLLVGIGMSPKEAPPLGGASQALKEQSAPHVLSLSAYESPPLS